MTEEAAAYGRERHVGTAQGLLALSPVGVFAVFYLVVSVVAGDFYKMPLSVAFLVASGWAILICRGMKLNERIAIYSGEAANPNVLFMVWIFILAGGFASLATGIGAVDATVGLTMQWLPPSMVIPGLFTAACVISFAVGTSVGTVVALTPLAVKLAGAVDAETAYFVAVVIGGAFFGDNLSFISDTTIAATRTQGCKLNDKFKANVLIVVPAALLTLAAYVLDGIDVTSEIAKPDVDYLLVVPYATVIVTAIAGVNVVTVLTLGILTALGIGLVKGTGIFDLAGMAGNGIDSMGDLIIVTLMAAGMLGVIKAMGGVDFLLRALTSAVKGTRGGQTCIAVLVGLINICTANNTVAIITVGPIARDIAERYDISPRKSASLLDTASCLVQCLIPYGAQTLLATSLAGISPMAPWRYLYYPWALLIMLAVGIVVKKRRLEIRDKR